MYIDDFMGILDSGNYFWCLKTRGFLQNQKNTGNSSWNYSKTEQPNATHRKMAAFMHSFSWNQQLMLSCLSISSCREESNRDNNWRERKTILHFLLWFFTLQCGSHAPQKYHSWQTWHKPLLVRFCHMLMHLRHLVHTATSRLTWTTVLTKNKQNVREYRCKYIACKCVVDKCCLISPIIGVVS